MMLTKEKYPLVSVCIPVYNVERYVARCVCSLMEQTYLNVEYIFVDDCSSDESMSVLSSVLSNYSSRQEDVRIIHHSHNRGLAAARNSAVEAASGQFIMHVDSDDWLENTAIERLMNRQQETGADIVSGNAIMHYSDHEELLVEPNYADKEAMLLNTLELTLDHVLWRRLIRTSLYKDNCIEAVEGANLGEDHYTLPRLIFFANSVAKVNEIVYHYNRENENSYCNQKDMWYKYHADMAAINILHRFFLKNDSRYLSKLEEIKQRYIADMQRVAMVMRDKPLFYHIIEDNSQSDVPFGFLTQNYYFCQLKRLIQKRLKR